MRLKKWIITKRIKSQGDIKIMVETCSGLLAESSKRKKVMIEERKVFITAKEEMGLVVRRGCNFKRRI